MNKTLKIEVMGFVSWLVPFLFSLFFYSSDDILLIEDSFLNSMKAVVSSFTAAVLIVYYFKCEKENYLKDGIVLGISWLLINIALDLLILSPSSFIELKIYLGNFGLKYLIIPIISISMGYVLEVKRH